MLHKHLKTMKPLSMFYGAHTISIDEFVDFEQQYMHSVKASTSPVVFQQRSLVAA